MFMVKRLKVTLAGEIGGSSRAGLKELDGIACVSWEMSIWNMDKNQPYTNRKSTK